MVVHDVLYLITLFFYNNILQCSTLFLYLYWYTFHIYPILSCVLFYISFSICITDSFNLQPFCSWCFLLFIFQCMYLFSVLFSNICFCPWCQDDVLHSTQFSLLSHYLLILIFKPSFLLFIIIQYIVFLNI